MSTPDDPQAFAALVQRESASLRSAPPPGAAALDLDECLAHGAELKDKVVLVTGSGSGFGRAYARKVASFGYVHPSRTADVRAAQGSLPQACICLDGPSDLFRSLCSAKLVLSDLRKEHVQEVADEIIAAGG